MDKLTQYGLVFNHFDENGDGKISPSELRQCVEAIGGELSLEEAEAVAKLLDSDRDGLVGLDDFVRFVEEGEEEEKVKDLREAFKMYEMEGCGCITPKSLKRMLGRLGECKNIDECQAMIARFDLDGDGVLSFDEFRINILCVYVPTYVGVPFCWPEMTVDGNNVDWNDTRIRKSTSSFPKPDTGHLEARREGTLDRRQERNLLLSSFKARGK
ncbi:putative calcium-binding protein CML19, partial [Mucuna pruriens]